MSLTAEQVEARKRGVGASEVLAALGKDPRCSRLELFKRKVGELPELDLSDNERVRFGNLLEPVIRDEFARRIGQQVIVPRQTLVHPSAPLLGHPDGWIPALNEGVEVKTADKFEAEDFGEPESDQVPVRYLVQCAGYMALTNADRWHLCVLIGGNDLRLYEIPRDPAIEAAVLAGVSEFWSHVEQRRPPDPATPEDVKIRWPKSLERQVNATPEIEQRIQYLRAVKEEHATLAQRIAIAQAEICTFMADAADLRDAKGQQQLATWRSCKDGTRLDVDALQANFPEAYRACLQRKPGHRTFLLKTPKPRLIP